MKVLVLKEYNNLVHEDVSDPEIGADDVLIQVKACGICGSDDVHGMDGSSGRRVPPLIMGHEAAGVVAEVGENVAGLKVGDRVTFDSTVYCGKCHFCRRGQINLCDNRRVLGVSCGEYRQHGAFAEYVAVPQRIVYPLPKSLGFNQAAVVEALSIAVHAVERTLISVNDTAVVVGVGMIGLLVLQVLKNTGCGRIVAVDVDPAKLDMAKKLGADDALLAEEACESILELTSGRGADIAIEAVGNSAAVNTAIECIRKGGILTMIGNMDRRIELPMQSVVTRELTLNGSCASCGEYPACLDLIAAGKVDVDSLISAVAPLSEGAEWFKRLYKKAPGLMKVILTP